MKRYEPIQLASKPSCSQLLGYKSKSQKLLQEDNLNSLKFDHTGRYLAVGDKAQGLLPSKLTRNCTVNSNITLEAVWKSDKCVSCQSGEQSNLCSNVKKIYKNPSFGSLIRVQLFQNEEYIFAVDEKDLYLWSVSLECLEEQQSVFAKIIDLICETQSKQASFRKTIKPSQETLFPLKFVIQGIIENPL